MTTGDSELDETRQQEDIDSVVSLINRNERFVNFLSIDDYFITDETINNINPTKLDLIYLSINCRNLSFGSVVNLIESQKQLKYLQLFERNLVTYETVGYFNFTSKVEILRIESSRFTPNQFSRFIRLFRKLDTFLSLVNHHFVANVSQFLIKMIAEYAMIADLKNYPKFQQ
jgi:hypothetical protein